MSGHRWRENLGREYGARWRSPSDAMPAPAFHSRRPAAQVVQQARSAPAPTVPATAQGRLRRKRGRPSNRQRCSSDLPKSSCQSSCAVSRRRRCCLPVQREQLRSAARRNRPPPCRLDSRRCRTPNRSSPQEPRALRRPPRRGHRSPCAVHCRTRGNRPCEVPGQSSAPASAAIREGECGLRSGYRPSLRSVLPLWSGNQERRRVRRPPFQRGGSRFGRRRPAGRAAASGQHRAGLLQPDCHFWGQSGIAVKEIRQSRTANPEPLGGGFH